MEDGHKQPCERSPSECTSQARCSQCDLRAKSFYGPARHSQSFGGNGRGGSHPFIVHLRRLNFSSSVGLVGAETLREFSYPQI